MQKKGPVITTPLLNYPCRKIVADLCEINGQRHIVVMDYYSRFIEIPLMFWINSKLGIMKLKNKFVRWGIPKEFVSDNESQFLSSEFVSFSKVLFKRYFSKVIQVLFMSPHHPQGNGEAESGVRIAKRILRQKDPFLALMSYRATPTQATKSTTSHDGTSNSNASTNNSRRTYNRSGLTKKQ